MKFALLAEEVISYDKKRVMDDQPNSSQMFEVLNIVRPKLNHKQPKKFKSFLKAMEQSDDPLLGETAMRLG